MKLSPRAQGVAAGAVLTEAQFLRVVTELAHVAGGRTYHAWSSLHSPAGWPDLAAAKAGEPLILAALKTAVSKVTPFQQSWQVESVEGYVWRPADWPEIGARLLSRGRGPEAKIGQ